MLQRYQSTALVLGDVETLKVFLSGVPVSHMRGLQSQIEYGCATNQMHYLLLQSFTMLQ